MVLAAFFSEVVIFCSNSPSLHQGGSSFQLLVAVECPGVLTIVSFLSIPHKEVCENAHSQYMNKLELTLML